MGKSGLPAFGDVAAAEAEVDRHADHQPDGEPDSCVDIERDHHGED
jgi:hypothetical protein